MIEPLASYHEVRVDVRRWFELYKDRIFVRGKTINAEVETTVLLADLRPIPDILYIRHRWFAIGALMLLLTPLALFGTAVVYGTAPEQKDLISILGSISFVFFLTGLVICLYTYKKVKFVRFQNHNGILLLDVADSGPDRDRFDSFIEELTARIAANAPDRPAES